MASILNFFLLLTLAALFCPANYRFRGSGRPKCTTATTHHPRPPPPLRHHVFISHRGPDGRHKFSDHLDAALRRKGLNVFRDDRDLPRGENVTEAISRAIDESMLSVVVLSRGYASSEYCLDELVEIMRGRKMKGHRPFPVFYKVSPDDDVAEPAASGVYKADLDRHKRKYSYERVDSWIHALRSISRISGWLVTDHTSEAEMVERIAEEMLWKVNDMLGPEEEEEEEEEESIVRMGVANGTASTIRWENVVVHAAEKKILEGSSNIHEVPQAAAAGEDR